MTQFLIHNMAPLMFVGLFAFLLLGYPVAFALAANGIVFGLIGIELGLLSPSLFQALPERIWGVMSNDTLLAVPFFTLMGQQAVGGARKMVVRGAQRDIGFLLRRCQIQRSTCGFNTLQGCPY